MAEPGIEGRTDPGVALTPLSPEVTGEAIAYRHVTVAFNRDERNATLTVRGPGPDYPKDEDGIFAAGADLWHLRAFRELDDALCRLRFLEPEIGLIQIMTEGSVDDVLAADKALHASDHWFAREVINLVAEVLRRLDGTARSIFARAEPGSCFAGCLLELALAADRTYALDDPDNPVTLAIGSLNAGALTMSHGLTRLQVRFLGDAEKVSELTVPALMARGEGPMAEAAAEQCRFDAAAAVEAGLVTVAADDIDYEDEIRQDVEERVSLSPDALTGMEQNLRFPGAESAELKIFGRLSAWQNWIFQRPNAVGERGALTMYGQPQRPSFDWRRT